MDTLAVDTVREATAVRRKEPSGARRPIRLKRARDVVGIDDGMRVLVDRLWPRGLTKDAVEVDLWLKDAAPTTALRRWYGHDASRWESFARQYRAELLEHHGDMLQLLDELSRRGPVTLVYDASDTVRNNAVVLHQLLSERRSSGRARRN